MPSPRIAEPSRPVNPLAKSVHDRRGAIIVLTALLMITMMAMLAFSIDVGYMMTVRTELQRAVDAGALAGAGLLVQGVEEAESAVQTMVQQNIVGDQEVSEADLSIETGHWDEQAQAFIPSTELPSAVRVRAVRNGQGLFFARALGNDQFDVDAEAIAMYRPRDIMLVLDYSGSMNDDSEFRHINSIGQDNIEANLLQIYQEFGSPSFGDMQWDPVYIASDTNAVIMENLGLTDVPYPHPSGSWNDFINYVKNDGDVNAAGYRKSYGYMTLVNYWLESKPRIDQTPGLWQTSEQPITAVKDAVTVFLAYLQEVDTDDQLGLSVYTYSNGNARLESPLTHDFQSVEDISRERQAGHYDVYTNIGAGILTAREELENNARGGAFKMIVLMTDGIANRPSDTSTARAYALEQAQICADNHFPIVTISLGAGADTGLMDQIANMTGGVHFNVPGGQTVAEYEKDLKDVFRQIADDRPLKLVK